MIRRGLLPAIAAATLFVGTAWYLHDPPWVADVTSGILNWEEEAGTRLRWTNGHAAFFIPSEVSELTVPMRSWFPGPGHSPVVVSVSIDDRWLVDVALPNEHEWVTSTLPLPRRATSRRHRRVELRVSRTVPPFHLGVELGVVRVR